MSKYKVNISNKAKAEIKDQYKYICSYADTIDVADNWYEQTMNEIAKLAYIHGFSEYPFIKKFKAQKKIFGKGRHFQFILIYTVNDEKEEILIIHCLNCKQKPVKSNLILSRHIQRHIPINRRIAFIRYNRRKVLCRHGN